MGRGRWRRARAAAARGRLFFWKVRSWLPLRGRVLRRGWWWGWWVGHSRPRGSPGAVILSCVLQVGLGPRGSGRSMAGQGNAPRARRVRVRPGRGLGQAGARRAEARGGLRPRKAWTGLPISLFLLTYLFFPPMAALAGESRLLHSGLAPRSWKVSDREAWWESADPGRQGRGEGVVVSRPPWLEAPQAGRCPGGAG